MNHHSETACRNSTIILFSLLFSAMNIFAISNYIKENQYKIVASLISMCIFLTAPCHRVPPPLNRYRKTDTTFFLGFAVLISAVSAAVKPVLILCMVIAETLVLFCVIKWQLLRRLLQFFEHLQRTAAYRKLPEPIGSLAEAFYYFTAFGAFGFVLYGYTSSTIVLILLEFIAATFLLPLCIHAFTVIMFNKEVLLKRSISGYSRCSTAFIKRVRCGNVRWILYGYDDKVAVTIPNAMVGDMQQLLTLCKSKKARN